MRTATSSKEDEQWLLSFDRRADIDQIVGSAGSLHAQCTEAGGSRLACTTATSGADDGDFGFFQPLFDASENEDVDWAEPVIRPLPHPER